MQIHRPSECPSLPECVCVLTPKRLRQSIMERPLSNGDKAFGDRKSPLTVYKYSDCLGIAIAQFILIHSNYYTEEKDAGGECSTSYLKRRERDFLWAPVKSVLWAPARTSLSSAAIAGKLEIS